ncbi:MAG: hypothetical protein ACK4IK_07590 [Bacteroidia bacterium]
MIKNILLLSLVSFTILACNKGFEKKEIDFTDELNDLSGWEIEQIPLIVGTDTSFIGKVETLNGLMNIEIEKGTVIAKKQLPASPKGALRKIQMKIRVETNTLNAQSNNELIVHYRGQRISYTLKDYMKNKELLYDYSFGKKIPRTILSEPMHIQHFDTIPNNEIIFMLTGRGAKKDSLATRLAIDKIEFKAW